MDPNSWFCQINGQQYGPYAPAQLKQFVAEGRLQTTSLVRQAISNAWVPAASVPGLFGPGFPTPAAPMAVGVTPAYHPPSYPAQPSPMTNPPAVSPANSGGDARDDEPRKRRSPIVLFTLVALAALFVGGSGCWLLVQLARQVTTAVEPETPDETEMEAEPIHISPKQIQAALDGVTHWTDALTTTKLGAKSFRFDMEEVWVQKDQKSGAGERFIYVQMKIMNPETSGAPLHYLTWNRAATSHKMPTVVMVDSHGHLCPLSSAYAAGTPYDEVQILEPGDEITEVLAFAYPKSDFDYVNLAFSYEAVDQGKRYFGYKIPRSMMGDERHESTKTGSTKITKSHRRGNDKEPSLDEINRQNNRNVKKMNTERKKQLENDR